MKKRKMGFYEKYIKRLLDFLLSLIAIIVLLPVLIILIILCAIFMKGNPFFCQNRIGKNEKIFKLIKFRTMTNEKDKNGKLLSNEKRLTKFGKFLRKTSLDELPELFTILFGDMSFVGPRPLLVEYLPYYTADERLRHDVRPGLTGYAQVNGRNAIKSWEERFNYDLRYIKECSIFLDIKIIFMTIYKVVKRSDILEGNNVIVGRLDDERKEKNQ